MRSALPILAALVALVVIVALSAAPARAMPEYAALTGEPCATCHVSPAGGGLRNLRGQAWVMSGKPSTVPSTTQALKILGIQLPSDMSIYTAAPSVVPTTAPFDVEPPKGAPLFQELLNYEGN